MCSARACKFVLKVVWHAWHAIFRDFASAVSSVRNLIWLLFSCQTNFEWIPLLIDSVASCTGYQIEVKCEAPFFISDSILSILSCKVNEVLDLRSLIWMFIAAANSLIKKLSKICSHTRVRGQWMHALIFFNTACRCPLKGLVWQIIFPTYQSNIWI